MAQDWFDSATSGASQPAPRSGGAVVIRNPWKAKEEARKEEDQQIERQRLWIAQQQAALAAEAEARQREQMNKPPAGFQRNPDGTMSFIPGGPADPAMADAARKAAQEQSDRMKRLQALRGQLDRVESLYSTNLKGGAPNQLNRFVPGFLNEKLGQFDTSGAGLAEQALGAFRVPGVGSQSDAELRAFVEANRPLSTDSDLQIEEKLGNIRRRLDAELSGQQGSATVGTVNPVAGALPAAVGGNGGGPSAPVIDPNGGQPLLSPADRAFLSKNARMLGAQGIRDYVAARGLSIPDSEIQAAVDYYTQGGQQDVAVNSPQGEGSIWSGVASSPFGSYGIHAMNGMTAGGLDEIVDFFGGDASRVQAAKELAGKENPIASTLGSITGAAIGTELTGGLMGSIPMLARAAKVGGGIIPDLAFGAATGAGEAEDGNRVAGALMGAGLAGAGNVVGSALVGGAGRAVRGVSDPVVRALQESGIPLTGGQMLSQGGLAGRAIKGIEDKMESVPLLGDAIRQRRQEGYEAFNQAAFREALEPINAQVQGTVGNDAIEQAQDLISQYYDDSLSGVRLARTPALDESVAAALAAGQRVPNMGEDVGYSVAQALANFGEDGAMTGRGFQTAISGLRKDAKGLIRKDGLRGNDAAASLRSVEEALTGLAREQAPGVTDALAAGNKAYGNLSVLEDAVLKALNGSDGPGVFTPAQLGQASRANTKKFAGKRAAARGDMPFAELQENAQAVLPSTVPNSGTTDRALATWVLPAALGGTAAAGEATDYIPTELAVPMALLGASSTKTGRTALEKFLLSRSEAARSIGNKIYDNRAIGGDVGAALLLGYGTQ